MYTIVTYDCKFKINQEYIENMLQHYGLRKIQSSLYWGELNNNERETLVKNIDVGGFCNELVNNGKTFSFFCIRMKLANSLQFQIHRRRIRFI